MAEENWYYSEDGETSPPVTLAALRMMLKRGELTPVDHVFRDGWDEWAAAKDVEVLWAQPDDEPDADDETEEEAEDADALKTLSETITQGKFNQLDEAKILQLFEKSAAQLGTQGGWSKLEPSEQGALFAIGSVICAVLFCTGWMTLFGTGLAVMALMKLGREKRDTLWRRVAMASLVFNAGGFLLFLVNLIQA